MLCVVACASPLPPGRSAASVRKLVPVPICLRPLPRQPAPGTRLELTSSEYWSLLWPDLGDDAKSIDALARDCAGGQPLASLASQSEAPIDVSLGTALSAKFPDKFELVWLPTGRADAGAEVGLIALVRPLERRLEVYAIGTHVGEPKRTRLALERIGHRLVVAALEDGCGDAALVECESTARLYLVDRGRLGQRASIPFERRSGGPERGSAEYTFSAQLAYRPNGVNLAERLEVRDRQHGNLRSLELQRTLSLTGGRLMPSSESLWERALEELAETPTRNQPKPKPKLR